MNITGMHIGRSWVSHDIEDACPCPQAPCGLVDGGTVADECDQHPPSRARSMRQGHYAENCPATRATTPPAETDHEPTTTHAEDTEATTTEETP